MKKKERKALENKVQAAISDTVKEAKIALTNKIEKTIKKSAKQLLKKLSKKKNNPEKPKVKKKTKKTAKKSQKKNPLTAPNKNMPSTDPSKF